MTTSRSPLLDLAVAEPQGPAGGAVEGRGPDGGVAAHYGCLLYTSDAADE